MRRQSTGKRISISQRDIEIFRLLDRYRYLRSTYLHAFLGGNRKRFIERLGHLFHEGYIGRPAQQWEFANARYAPVIYELDTKAQAVLSECGSRTHDSLLLSRGPMNGSRHFAHQLMIADILASIELGVRENPALRFVGWREILDNAPQETQSLPSPFRIPVSFSYAPPRAQARHRLTTAVVPDGIFGLEYNTAGIRTYRFFVLEADRAQMPIIRRDPAQSSYLKKLLAYHEIAKQGLYKSQLGLPNFLVLTVTIHERHMHSIMTVLDSLTADKAREIFLFNTLPNFQQFQPAPLPISNILTNPWARVGHSDFRIDK